MPPCYLIAGEGGHLKGGIILCYVVINSRPYKNFDHNAVDVIMQWSVTINSDLGRHKWGSNLKEPIQQKKYNHGQIRCSSLKNPACDYFSTIIRHFTPAKVKVLILAWISDGSDNGNSVFGIHT